MTDAERLEAARVMAGPGPWDVRCRPNGPWIGKSDNPGWDWSGYEYRLRPAPPPAPLPCLCCGSTIGPEWQDDCSLLCDCGCMWFPERRKPCPTCAMMERIAEAAARASENDEWNAKEALRQRNAAISRAEAAENRCAEFASRWQNSEHWQGRAEAAERRCAEVTRKIRHWAHNIPPGIAGDLLATLEGRDHAK